MMFKRSNLSRCLAVALALWTGGPVFAAFNGPSTFTPSGQLPETLQARALLQAFVQDYGASGSTATASGSSITGATAALTLGSAQDFKNGQGVLIPGAGSTETAPASSCTATVNGVAGSTTINYYVVTLDFERRLCGGGNLPDDHGQRHALGAKQRLAGGDDRRGGQLFRLHQQRHVGRSGQHAQGDLVVERDHR